MKKILFLPIDIDIPEISFPILENVKSNLPGASFWSYENLIENKEIKKNIDPSKKIFETILKQLPILDLHIARLSIQDKKVNPHIDVNLATHQIDSKSYQNILKNEPCGYRLLIDGSKDTLKIISNNKIISTQLPKVPMLYVINSTELLHFIEGDIGRKTLYIRGTINEPKHKELIDRSLKKYSDFCIYND